MSAMEKRPRKEQPGERIAKVMARAGLCSRRDAEAWIANGRVSVNGKKLGSAAMNVGPKDIVLVDGKPLPERELTRVWLYYKPKGLMTTAYDPEGRATVFENLPADMPRVISVGRLDLNSEGLLLLTNDGELARKLELPATAWIRRYRVRVNGRIDPKMLETLKNGIEIEGVRYGPIEANFERQQGANAWLTMALTEGKNREIRRICQHFGWPVSRLIRIAYGPFQLGEMEPGQVQEAKGKTLQGQLRFGNDWRPPAKAEIAPEVPALREEKRFKQERKTRPRHDEEMVRPQRKPRGDAPRWSARPTRDDQEARQQKPARRQRDDRPEVGERPAKPSFKKGWAKNKPAKPQPGSSWKPRPKREDAEPQPRAEKPVRDKEAPQARAGRKQGKPGSGHARRFR
jgi:23S rRNA pseudouridine2605 synthase